jgi:RNA polymerase sigma-70 factor (ECF subfamily)
MNDDQQLVRKALKGDRGAFEMIVRRYRQPVLNYIGRMVREREVALDLSQDVFVKAYAALRSYRPQFKFTTWLFRIASNTVIDYWRKKKLSSVSLDQPIDEDCPDLTLQVAADGPSVERAHELGELRAKIEAALENVPLALRELFVWRHVNGFSYEEMAEMKGLPVGTVKNRVFQAKEMMKKLLGEPA